MQINLSYEMIAALGDLVARIDRGDPSPYTEREQNAVTFILELQRASIEEQMRYEEQQENDD